MTSSTETVRRGDGAPDVLIRRWPAAGRPWASMLIVHAIAEHSGRYQHVGSGLADVGVDVAAIDLRGNGGSGGTRAHVERWSDYLDDVESGLAAVRASAGERPVVLLGHSLGGLIVLDYATSGRPAPDLLVLASPALDSTIPGWKKALARALSRISPTMRIKNELTGDQLSADPSVGERYFADPLVERTTTVRLAAEGLATQTRVVGRLGSLSIPTLVFHGTADTIVPVAASEPLAELPGVRRTVYPDLRHETMNEPAWPAVVADLIAWLREQVPPDVAPSAASPVTLGGGPARPDAAPTESV
jgi:alpha-beta hydrolase superfamily lysophospholipase